LIDNLGPARFPLVRTFALIATGILASASLHAAERPNILFFFVDDMGVTDTSVPFLFDSDGQPVKTPLNQRYRTPNMERLAQQGRRFSNAHAYSVCTPTRAALMTGQEAARTHITTWTAPERVRDTGTFDMEGIR
jgi:arylsulfatase A-like enzyme